MSEMFDKFAELIEFSVKMKEDMVANNFKKARRTCPFCLKNGLTHKIHAVLHPNKRFHKGFAIHLYCDGPCKTSMME